VSPWVQVERAAGRGDLVEAEITPLAGAHGEAHAPETAETPEGSEPPALKTDKIAIEVGDPNVWEELALAVSGLTAGQETTFVRRHEHEAAPGDTEGGEKVVHEQTFKVKVDQVKERDLHPLDDELAKKISPDFTTMDQLTEAVTKAAAPDQDRAAQRGAQPRSPRPAPRAAPTRAAAGRGAQGDRRPGCRTMPRGSPGAASTSTRRTWTGNGVASEMLPLAERRVHARLLLDAISDAESIQVTEEEFERCPRGGRPRPEHVDAGPASRARRGWAAGQTSGRSSGGTRRSAICSVKTPARPPCRALKHTKETETHVDSDGCRADEPGRARV